MPARGIPPTGNALRLRGRAIGDLSSIADGDGLAWDAGASQFVPASGGGGAAALGVGMVVGVAFGAVDGDAPPTGTLWCEGQNVSRATYADLFATIGTTWGSGDGSTTFGLPDLRGRTLLGRSAAGSPTQVGATGGSRDATLVAHSHSVTDGSTQLTRGNGTIGAGPYVQGQTDTPTTAYGTDTQGSSATDANLPPYAGVRWAIVAESSSTAPRTVARFTLSAPQTIATGGSPSVIEWDTALSDPEGWLGSAGQILPGVGTYRVSAQWLWTDNAIGNRNCGINLNAVLKSFEVRASHGSFSLYSRISWVVVVTDAAHAIEVVGFQSSGGDLSAGVSVDGTEAGTIYACCTVERIA